MLFRRISLYFMTGFCIFREQMAYLEIVLKNKNITGRAFDCRSRGRWFNSARSFFIITGCLSKAFRRFKD